MTCKIFFKTVIFFVLATLQVFAASAQEINPVAVSTEKGVWVYLGNEIPKDFQYQVIRKDKKDELSQVGTTSFKLDVDEANRIIQEYQNEFNNLEKINHDNVNKLLDYAKNHTTADSISINNLPVMHLILGTAIFDPDVKTGNEYQYQVVKLNKKGNKVWEKSSNTLKYDKSTNLPKPVFVSKQESDSKIILYWNMNDQNTVNSFNVYRRVFAQGDYERINAEKGYNALNGSIELVTIDTEVKNPAYYEYYIAPIDIYGNDGPHSDMISAGTMGNMYNPVPEYFYARGKEQNHQVELKWKLQDKKYLRSIEVYRSASYDDGYVMIARLSPGDSSYVDVVPGANENFWYYLKLIGPTAQSMPSAKVSVLYKGKNEKPVPPEEVGAETVNGGVKVHWLYDQPYVKGFYVYRYVYETSGYILVSGLVPAESRPYSFIDSAETISGNDIYRYAVCAVNDLDRISDFSPSASASPGKKAILNSPVNLRSRVMDKGLLLMWDDMRDEIPALMGYKVSRKSDKEKGYTFLMNDTLVNSMNYFADTTVIPGLRYKYIVTSIDYYGNESPASRPLNFYTEPATIRPPEITGTVNTTDGIMISWGQISDSNIKSIRIYRTTPGQQPTIVADLTKESINWLDKSITNGTLYIYELTLVTNDGIESSKSRSASIRR